MEVNDTLNAEWCYAFNKQFKILLLSEVGTEKFLQYVCKEYVWFKHSKDYFPLKNGNNYEKYLEQASASPSFVRRDLVFR